MIRSAPWSWATAIGANIVRNVIERPEFELIALCERDQARIAEFEKRTPATPA